MTEEEWLACRYVPEMLEYWIAVDSERKLRLFACACCARIWPSITDERSRTAVRTAERFAESGATADELEVACDAAHHAAEELYAATFETERTNAIAQGLLSETDETFGIWEYASLVTAPAHAACYAAIPPENNLCFNVGDVAEKVASAVGFATESAFFDNPNPTHRDAVVDDERGKLADLLRDIFGNPFRPVALDPAWLTSDVVALAKGIYDERAFERMPILADALQDAGCNDPEVLMHCRNPGVHVRGCWVVDLLTGRK